MHFGFSYTGLLLLLMLFIPNIFWTKNQPADYDQYVQRENKVLLFLERAGEVRVTGLLLVFRDFNVQGVEPRLLWLAAAFALMILYELHWIRYFRSEKTMRDFYSSFLRVPVAGATLPVLAVLLMAVYGRNPLLFAVGIILGIGHIGIHLQHAKEVTS